MKVLLILNRHRYRGGSDLVAEVNLDILKRRGHVVNLISRDSRQLGRGLLGKIRAFACGVYCKSGRRIIAKHIREHKPDIVHVHELYPFFSPWILPECRLAGVPVVLTCHDYRLTCPTYQHLCKGMVCELCADGREYWCVFKNCADNIFESIAYALWNAVARKFHLFHDNVSYFISLSEFAKVRFSRAGFSEDRIALLPNMVSIPDVPDDPPKGEYVAYVGRISSEKGLDTLLSAASRLCDLPVKIAGDGKLLQELVSSATNNVSFLGYLKRDQLATFYRKARFLVVPSKWYEPFGLVIVEAMSHCLPVIGSRIGGIPDIIDDGITGLLFEPGNASELEEKIKVLWEDPDLCRQMGVAGREKAISEYSEGVYYRRLMAIYEKAIKISS